MCISVLKKVHVCAAFSGNVNMHNTGICRLMTFFMFIKWTIFFLNSVTLTGENQGKWKKYLVKIEKAVEDYKDCTLGDCSCHRRYREFTINYFTMSIKHSIIDKTLDIYTCT